MIIVLIRTLILFTTIFLTMKSMGKRYIAQLEPHEFVVSVMIAELATIPLEDTSIPLFYGIVCILSILILEIILTQFQLKSMKIRKALNGTSVLLIENGKFLKENLKKEKLTINDVLEEIRYGGYYDISKIAFAILENNGKISVIPEDKNNKLMLPTSLVIDGEILEEGLKYINRNRDWLNKQLKENNIKSLKQIFYAYTDDKGDFKFQLDTEGK